MNAQRHAELSARNHGGRPEDYYAIHDFMDWTKEVESSNAHRAWSHNMWWIKEIAIPIWGHTLINSEGRGVNVKDLLESDHVLADFNNRFLPTLRDYTDLVRDDAGDEALIRTFDEENAGFYAAYPEVRTLMLSPLAITGQIKSLLITHSSWFVQRILPLVFPRVKIEVRGFSISPSVFFNRMTWADWLQNGQGAPPSFAKINERRKAKTQPLPEATYDGTRLPEGAKMISFPMGLLEDVKTNLQEQSAHPMVIDGPRKAFPEATD